MEFTGLGTAVMFALAAVLWFVYLVPTWFRRREYLATERNVTRLQQTLRIMAETAETPEEVRVEASARDAVRQARRLDVQRRAEEARERQAMAIVRRAAAASVPPAERARRRLRRARLIAASTLLLTLAGTAVQLTVLLTAGATTAGWILLGAAAVGALLSQRALAGLARRRVGAAAAPGLSSAVSARHAGSERTPSAAAPARAAGGWTPVPVPRPLYLDRPAEQSVVPPRDPERLMREASAAAQAALRAAHREAEVVAMPSAPQPAAQTGVAPASARVADAASASPATAATPSRWAAMGVVDDVDRAVPDLDEVLRRRRLAG